MLIPILGVALWAGAHLFKRLAPARRAGLGDKGKGLVSAALVVAIVLMVIGYRTADGAVLWGRSPALVGINNLLMLTDGRTDGDGRVDGRTDEWMSMGMCGCVLVSVCMCVCTDIHV